jgi:predicted secreted hydrolase
MKKAILAAVVLAMAANAFGGDWKQAIEPWSWSLPRDHGAHPDFRTEWWYFTGNLTDSSGRPFGYQLTFFRQGIAAKPDDPGNPWSVRDIYLAHFTITAGTTGQFSAADRISRKGPGLAEASASHMNIRLLSWSAVMEDGKIHLQARHGGMELSIDLTPRKTLIYHGRNGLSRKGAGEGQASYYVSYTDLETRGSIRTPGSRQPLNVRGKSWFDHEFGSNQLSANQVGWDWFSLHLSDGRDLMIYFIRQKDGAVEPASSGTLISDNGASRGLKLSEISVEVLDHWKSPKSGGRYPSRWKIAVPSAEIELNIEPLLADQELLTPGSTGVTYWEGAVKGKGRSAGTEVTCEGYVELTGYAGGLNGLF